MRANGTEGGVRGKVSSLGSRKKRYERIVKEGEDVEEKILAKGEEKEGESGVDARGKKTERSGEKSENGPGKRHRAILIYSTGKSVR